MRIMLFHDLPSSLPHGVGPLQADPGGPQRFGGPVAFDHVTNVNRQQMPTNISGPRTRSPFQNSTDLELGLGHGPNASNVV